MSVGEAAAAGPPPHSYTEAEAEAEALLIVRQTAREALECPPLLLPIWTAARPPPCWLLPIETWRLWLESAEATRMSPPSPCEDCTLRYAQRMRRRGLCTNHTWRPPIIEIDPPLRRVGGTCELDGHTFEEHAQCRRCELLAGAEHVRRVLVDGLCERCCEAA